MQSLSLVMSECFLSGRGQGHESHFYIVDLENFATFFLFHLHSIGEQSNERLSRSERGDASTRRGSV